MPSAIGRNSIWLRGNRSQVVLCSQLCKQYVFCLHQRELRHDKQRLCSSCIFHVAWTGRHFQKAFRITGTFSPDYTNWQPDLFCRIHELPPPKLRNSVDEGVHAPNWHQECGVHAQFSSFSTFTSLSTTALVMVIGTPLVAVIWLFYMMTMKGMCHLG